MLAVLKALEFNFVVDETIITAQPTSIFPLCIKEVQIEITLFFPENVFFTHIKSSF